MCQRSTWPHASAIYDQGLDHKGVVPYIFHIVGFTLCNKIFNGF
jgi:hypothetical protein